VTKPTLTVIDLGEYKKDDEYTFEMLCADMLTKQPTHGIIIAGTFDADGRFCMFDASTNITTEGVLFAAMQYFTRALEDHLVYGVNDTYDE
jgi:hypothetical protein